MSAPDFFKNYGEWIYRALVVCSILAVAVLKQNFATAEDLFHATREIKQSVGTIGTRVTEMEKAMAVMVEQHKVNERQDTILRDHEERLRHVERKVGP